MKVVITTAARSDLAAINDYISADNPNRAGTLIDELLDRCDDLGAMAERFQLVPRFSELGIRRRPYKSYLIFYRVTALGVEVLHIVHGARDWEELLSAEYESDK